MRAPQQIFRIRRQYNKWVGNETLEDYSLRFTAGKARKFSIDEVAKTALGAAAFLALEAIAAAVTLNYGFTNFFWAMITVAITIFVTGVPICYHAAKHGLDIDLLTRSAGFGYLGSTITSLIYASFTFLFFAIEAAILASALNVLFAIPPAIGYLICAVAVIPIVTHGISAISRFQIATQPFWLALQMAALITLAVNEYQEMDSWVNYSPLNEGGDSGFSLAMFGGAAAILFALTAQIGEQVDYLRFMPTKTSGNSKRWWFWLLLAGPGWILIGMVKMLIGSFLAYLLVARGEAFERATDPIYMYQTVFQYITNSPNFALILAGMLVLISQMKINVTNAYAGSLAWSNFFSRLTHNHPGRVVWLVFNVLIALVLMELGIYRALESILAIFAIVALSWLSTLSADLLINKPLKLRPDHSDFKRAHLYDINPVGVVSMMFAAGVGVAAYIGLLGSSAKHVAPFISLLVCFLATPMLAILTKGRYYIARTSPALAQINQTSARCCICETDFELPDMAFCPAYQGTICSLCCSLDSRCLDSCKPQARVVEQVQHFFGLFLPKNITLLLNSRIGKFISIFLCINLFVGALFAMIYYHMSPIDSAANSLLKQTIWTLFFILSIVFGVLSWLFLLARESQKVAQNESNRQTKRLLEEIDAHRITDQYLQQAKEMAEQASDAKTRYLTGISHELRTPLQSILGYAQLLQQQPIQPEQQKALQIIHRSGEYLADLLEGLLDISKIEAGRLEIFRNEVKLLELLQQVIDMFQPLAETKGLVFVADLSESVPSYVITDERRLRQILINLLSNAVKYTVMGRIEFIVKYRNQVCEFTVKDTGVGIASENIERVLNPFERVRDSQVPNVSGTGLGLTIVRLLSDVMGGELNVRSEIGVGSEFVVSLMLSRIEKPVVSSLQPKPVIGYLGKPATVLVADDEAIHRGLIADLLRPLGFIVHEVANAEECYAAITESKPDILLLDVTMPGESGLLLAEKLRSQGYSLPIIIISADAQEQHVTPVGAGHQYDYMVKPISLQSLLENIGDSLGLQWLYEDHDAKNNRSSEDDRESLPDGKPIGVSHPLLRELKAYADLGYYRGVNDTIDKLSREDILTDAQFQQVQKLASQFRYDMLSEIISGEIDDGY